MRPLPGSGGAARATEGVWREINKSVGNDVVTGDYGPLEAPNSQSRSHAGARKKKTRIRGRRIRVKKGIAPITVILRPTTDEEAAGFRCDQATPAGTKSPLKRACKNLLFGRSTLA